MNKLIRDGKVAVIHTSDYGAGWSTWLSDMPAQVLLFDPVLAQMILDGTTEQEIIQYCEEMFGSDNYYGGADSLTVTWVPEGTEFIIHEYDGKEEVQLKDNFQWIKA